MDNKDKTKPVLEILSPENNTITNQNITLVYSVSDNTDTLADVVVDVENGTVYSEEGGYVITVNATDRAGNTASKTISFTIDKIKPEISNIQAYPEVQAQNGYVNISCTVTIEVDKVYVNITGPDGITLINTTMTRIAGTNSYYYNSTYNLAGNYTYYIWAVDTSGNGNKSSEYIFTIAKIEVTPPVNWLLYMGIIGAVIILIVALVVIARLRKKQQ